MSTMKRIGVILLLMGLLLLTGCGGKDEEATADTPMAETGVTEVETAVSPTTAPEPTAKPATAPEPTAVEPTAIAVTLGETTSSEEGGFSFQPIPDYALMSYGGVVNMLAPNADPDLGPMVMMMGGQSEATTAEDLYAELQNGTDMTVGEAEAITVQGLPGLAADISGDNNGKAMQGRVAMVMVTPTQSFTLLIGAPAAQWAELAPYFDGLLTAVSFFDPIIPPPTSSLTPGSYSYVNSNVVRDLVVQDGVAYAATLGGLAAWNLSDGYAMNYTPLQGLGHINTYALTTCEIDGEEQIVVGTLQGISLFNPFYGLWDTTPLTSADSLVATSQIDRLYCDRENGRLFISRRQTAWLPPVKSTACIVIGKTAVYSSATVGWVYST